MWNKTFVFESVRPCEFNLFTFFIYSRGNKRISVIPGTSWCFRSQKQNKRVVFVDKKQGGKAYFRNTEYTCSPWSTKISSQVWWTLVMNHETFHLFTYQLVVNDALRIESTRVYQWWFTNVCVLWLITFPFCIEKIFFGINYTEEKRL